MNFCINCKNYLFIRIKTNDSIDSDDNETEEQKDKVEEIVYRCLKCNYEKEVNDNCVYKKVYKKYDNLYKNHKYLNSDVTLPRKITTCNKCNIESNNVFYQCNNLSIVSICKECNHYWNSN